MDQTHGETRLRIGVLGAAKISPPALLQPALDTDGVEVAVIAARDRARAEEQADRMGIATVVDSYDDVLDSDVDAIYNPLPISLHHEWTIRALRAGKHVLCEKPFAANAELATEMVAVGEETGLVLMEAFHWRYHPLAERIAAILRSGAIGRTEHINATFTVPIPPTDDVRQSYELAGGALMDLGCYPVQWARFVAGSEPTVLASTMVVGRADVDVITDIDLEFAGGVSAHLHTAMHAEAERQALLEVRGSEGLLRVVNPLAPHHGHEVVIRSADGSETRETVDGRTTYHHQLEAFRDAVVSGTPIPTGGADAIATMKVIDAAYRTAGLPVRGA
jgi:predicted dehydrogenase